MSKDIKILIKKGRQISIFESLAKKDLNKEI